MNLRCIEFSRRVGDVRARGYASINAGSSLAQLGDLTKASALLEDGLSIFRRLGEAQMVAAANRELGVLRSLEGNYEGAMDAFQVALGIYSNEVKAPYYEAYTLWKLGEVLRRKGNFWSAREALERSLRLYEGLGSQSEMQKVREELTSLDGADPV